MIAYGVAGYYTATTGGFSGLSQEMPVTVVLGQAVTLTWSPVAYGNAADARTADSYAILRSAQAPGAANRTWDYMNVSPKGTGTQSGADNGQGFTPWPIATWWQLPGGVAWEVKNNFECKNCQRLLAEGNILSGNWQNGQNGVSVLFTPRVETNPPSPPMYSNRVQDITFTANVIAHTGGAFSILGYDYNQCSNEALCQQAQRILFANNLMYDVSGTYGTGNGWQFSAGEPGGSTGIIVDHNTLINDWNPVENDTFEGSLVMTNNIVPHNLYGIHSGGMGSAIQVFSQAFNPGVFTGNLYVGANSSETPPGNLLPPTLQDVGFTDAAGGNYKLLASSAYRGTATDGSDPGVNMDVLNAATTARPTRCTYTVTPSGLSFPVSGGMLPVTVQADPACGWLAESGATWAQISSSFATVGPGTVQINAGPNTSGTARSSSIQVADQLISVSQAAQSSCQGLSLSPLAVSLTGVAQQGAISVSAPSQCPWTVASDSWITVIAGGSGTGNGSIQYSVGSDTSIPRTGSLAVNGQSVTISQAVAVVTGIIPSNPVPANGATNISSAVLSWTGSGATSYQVYFGQGGTLPLLGSTPSTSFPLHSALSPGTTYYWQVQAITSTGNSWSPKWSFTTSVLPPPGPPGTLFVPVIPCRLVNTRNAAGPFGGPAIGGGSSRDFALPNASCGIPAGAAAYVLNVTAEPHGRLGYLTVWPTGQSLPMASTMNSVDGRYKANAAIVSAGTGGAVSVYASDTTDVALDISGYFVSSSTNTGLAFYPVPPCRLIDTRNTPGLLAGPFLSGGVSRTFPIAASNCGISAASAYSLNITAVPHGSLRYLTVWPTGINKPLVSTLNAPTGSITANAAIVSAGVVGSIDVYATADTDLVVDVNGYFGPAGAGGLSLYPVTPCRVLDTRNPPGSSGWQGIKTVSSGWSKCGVPTAAQAFVVNATVVPPGRLRFLTLWPTGSGQPSVSTLTSDDGAVTSNMAIVPSAQGSINAFASDPTQLILDLSGYFAP